MKNNNYNYNYNEYLDYDDNRELNSMYLMGIIQLYGKFFVRVTRVHNRVQVIPVFEINLLKDNKSLLLIDRIIKYFGVGIKYRRNNQEWVYQMKGREVIRKKLIPIINMNKIRYEKINVFLHFKLILNSFNYDNHYLTKDNHPSKHLKYLLNIAYKINGYKKENYNIEKFINFNNYGDSDYVFDFLNDKEKAIISSKKKYYYFIVKKERRYLDYKNKLDIYFILALIDINGKLKINYTNQKLSLYFEIKCYNKELLKNVYDFFDQKGYLTESSFVIRDINDFEKYILPKFNNIDIDYHNNFIIFRLNIIKEILKYYNKQKGIINTKRKIYKFARLIYSLKNEKTWYISEQNFLLLMVYYNLDKFNNINNPIEDIDVSKISSDLKLINSSNKNKTNKSNNKKSKKK